MLHIHNGGSTAGTLTEFGFPGDHFAFNEVLMAGPAPKDLSPDDWTTLRAEFLAAEYELKFEDCNRRLQKQDDALRTFGNHEEVILWFEHDMFCQINLIYLLDWFSRQPLGSTRLSLICIGEFPGVEDFRGLGQLTGEQLASLFDTRHQTTELELDTASRAWGAYCSSNPQDAARLLGEDTSAMPFFKEALHLHLGRFPSVGNGLGRIANAALDLISRGAINFKTVFPRFAKTEPTYGLGDSQFWSELKRLGSAREPLITIGGLDDLNQAFKSSRFHEASFEVTETGKQIFAGERDFIEVNGIDLWLGGVHLVDNDVWRWDEQRGEIVHAV